MSEAVEAADTASLSLEALVESFGLDDDESCGRCSLYKHEIARLISIELRKQRLKSLTGDVGTDPTTGSEQMRPASGGRRWPWLRR